MCSLIFLRSLNIFLDLCPRLQVCFIGFQSFGYFPCSLDHCGFFFVVVVVVSFFFLFARWFQICSLIFLRSLNIFLDLCPWVQVCSFVFQSLGDFP